jgi:O-antigen/teichoic acid export membrane protein
MSNTDHGTNPLQSLGSRTLRGTFWLIFGRTYQQVLLLCKVTVLGRLLGPEEFGLVGIALLTIQFLNTFTHTGFASALVQHPDPTDRDITTAWWVLWGRGILLTVILWWFAPWIAALFHEPKAIPVLRAFGGIQFLSAFTSIGLILLSKKLDFRTLFTCEAWSSTIELIVAVTIAFWCRNVWALVLGGLAGALVRLVVSYLVYPYFPKFTFDVRSACSLFKFGQWLLWGSVMIFIFTKLTDAMSGILFGAAALGIYQMAARFGLLPTNQFGDLFLNTMFPAYSLIQHDLVKLKLIFLKALQVLSLVVFPISVLMMVTIAPLLPTILGSQWAGVVSLVPALAIGGLIQALVRTGSPLFLATGKPRLQFAMDAASAFGTVVLLFPFAKYFGLEGLAWAYAAGNALGIPVWWRFVKQQGQAANRDIMAAILPTALASAALAIIIGIPTRIFLVDHGQWSFFVALLGLTMIGVLFFLVIVLVMERLVPGYKPIGEAVALIKTYLREAKPPLVEGAC